MATSRFSFVSVARYTSPIPPVPRRERILYGPRLSPGVMATAVGGYHIVQSRERIVSCAEKAGRTPSIGNAQISRKNTKGRSHCRGPRRRSNPAGDVESRVDEQHFARHGARRGAVAEGSRSENGDYVEALAEGPLAEGR